MATPQHRDSCLRGQEIYKFERPLTLNSVFLIYARSKEDDYFLFSGLTSHSKILYSYWDVNITCEGLQIFNLCSTLMVIEQWGFFSVPHLLWHGASVYNGHLWGSLALTLIAESLAGGFHYLFLRLKSVAAGIRENPTFRLCGQRSNPQRHHYGKIILKEIVHVHYTTYMARPNARTPAQGSWNLQFW